MKPVDIKLHVVADSDQPRQMVAAAAASAVRQVLDGWCEDVRVTLVSDGSENN